MNLTELMKSNDIELNCLFTLAKFKNKEGLMFFEPVQEVIDEQEVTNLAPKCILVDDSKFVYDEDLDNDYIVNAINDVVTLTRVDGIQLNIDTKIIGGFPFKLEQFKAKAIEVETSIPEGHVEIVD